MIIDARGDRSALERLLRLYWPPVYAFIRRQGFGSHDASDLTQEFLSKVVLTRGLLDRADPARGKFRSFLKQSLRNFLVDHHRASALRRAVNRPLSLSSPDAGPVDPAETTRLRDGETTGRSGDSGGSGTDDGVFDRQWAMTLVQSALERLEDALLADGMATHWAAFEVNIVGPALRKTQPLPLEELGRRLARAPGARSTAQEPIPPDVVSNMLQTTKRRFKRILREQVAETVSGESTIEEELAELRRLMGG